MEVRVAKFGGSSLADADSFRQVRAIVKKDPACRYVVPSAPGKRFAGDHKVTDLLYICYHNREEGISFDDVFAMISERYVQIVKELNLTIDIKSYLDEVYTNIKQGESVDYIASRGEYLNGLILAEYLEFTFLDPAEFIVFDYKGVFDSEETHRRIKNTVARIANAVIPGFYGARPNGEIKTFSRGGSDITGAIIARGVQASLYENWTDVSGFLMADPRIVENPKRIEIITYRELRELAYNGANVLHEESIFPVREAGIPIRIRNTKAPDDPGTLIVRDVPKGERVGQITGIAGRKEMTIISVEKALLNCELGFARRLLSILERNEISFEHMPSGIDAISLVITDCQLENKLDKVLNEIRLELDPDTVEVFHDIALISTVGQGMAFTAGMAAKLFVALAEEKINIRMIDQGSSEINIIVGVQTKDFERAIKAIYNAYVN